MEAAMKTTKQQWIQAEQDQVRASLAIMLASPLFARSPRQQRFLDYLVTNTLAGDASRLKGYTIAVEVFDRKDDFDPSIDAIVRVGATRLRSKLHEYYDTLNNSDEVRIDFPKGSYVLEIAMQRSQTKKPIAPTNNAPRFTDDKPSLAVLPFANIGVDNAKEYFADGVVDSLISMFSRLSGLFVISRQSSFSYKNTIKTSHEIATELGVRYLLEGSVQHADNKVRVMAQLVDTHHGGQVWSERYDRELKDIFALQDELTQNIVGVLQIKLAGDEAKLFGYKDTNNIEAHDLMLRGVAEFRKYTEKAVYESIELLKKAVLLDPSYSAAYAWLARVVTFRWIGVWVAYPNNLVEGLSYAEKAVDLDPQSPYALSILSWVQSWRKNSVGSIATGRKAVALDPNNAEAHLFLSLALVSAGFGEEGLYYIEKARRFTPTSSPLHALAHGLCFYVLKDFHKAAKIMEEDCMANPTFIPLHYQLMVTYHHLGLEDEVKRKLKVVLELNGGQALPDFGFWANKKLTDERNEVVKEIQKRYPW
jgi:adenylate cyclase